MTEVSLLRTHFQQTNQPTIPTTYISIRITLPHSEIDKITRVFDTDSWYIIYPHFGGKKDNEHFHILVPGNGPKCAERYRSRIKRADNLGLSGNKCLSVKSQDNTVCCGIQYCSREGTEPVVKGDHVSEWIALSPKWVSKSTGVKRKRDDDGPIKLTCVNHVTLAFEYRREKGLLGNDLCEVVRRMLDSGDYVVDANFMRSGAPDFLIDVFKDSVEAGRVTWKAMSCRGGLWKPPRQGW